MDKEIAIDLIIKNSTNLTLWTKTLSEEEFFKNHQEDKWSTAQQIDHLRKTSKLINRSFYLSKPILWYRFGKLKREEHDYETLEKLFKDKIKVSVLSSPQKLMPGDLSSTSKTELINRYVNTNQKLITSLRGKKEAYLSNYVLPHPILGKLSIREMAYFVAIHTQHHFDLILKYAGSNQDTSRREAIIN